MILKGNNPLICANFRHHRPASGPSARPRYPACAGSPDNYGGGASFEMDQGKQGSGRNAAHLGGDRPRRWRAAPGSGRRAPGDALSGAMHELTAVSPHKMRSLRGSQPLPRRPDSGFNSSRPQSTFEGRPIPVPKCPVPAASGKFRFGPRAVARPLRGPGDSRGADRGRWTRDPDGSDTGPARMLLRSSGCFCFPVPGGVFLPGLAGGVRC